MSSLTNPNSELVSRVFPVAMGTADEHLWAPNPKSKRQHIQTELLQMLIFMDTSLIFLVQNMSFR